MGKIFGRDGQMTEMAAAVRKACAGQAGDDPKGSLAATLQAGAGISGVADVPASRTG